MKITRNALALLPALALLAALALPSCSGSRQVEYVYYEGLRPEDQAFIESMVGPGEALYKKSCASCHGIFGKGKQGITNFSEEQLHGYKNSYIMGDLDNHAVIDHLTEHELDQILMFLMFVKRDS